VVVTCPRWGNLQGQIQVYSRNETTQELLLVYSEIGNDTASRTDYFNIGASADLLEHNWNHATLFYTSTLTNSTINNVPMNYTHINTVEIFRFKVN
jgi:hypothetical protein